MHRATSRSACDPLLLYRRLGKGTKLQIGHESHGGRGEEKRNTAVEGRVQVRRKTNRPNRTTGEQGKVRGGARDIDKDVAARRVVDAAPRTNRCPTERGRHRPVAVDREVTGGPFSVVDSADNAIEGHRNQQGDGFGEVETHEVRWRPGPRVGFAWPDEDLRMVRLRLRLGLLPEGRRLHVKETRWCSAPDSCGKFLFLRRLLLLLLLLSV